MQASEIQTLLISEPFQPFRLQMTRTGHVDITSRVGVLLTRDTLYVGQSPDATGVFASILQVPLAQATSVQPL